MKILLHEPWRGGHSEVYLACLARGVARLGHEVSICTAANPAFDPPLRKTLEEHHDRISWDLSLPPRVISRSIDKVTLVRELDEAVREHDPDLCILPSADALSLGGFRHRPASADRVIAIHHYLTPLLHGPAKRRIRSLMYYAGLARSGWRRSLAVNEFAGLPGLRLRHAPDPIDIGESLNRQHAREKLRLPLDGTMIAVTGVLDHRKDLSTLHKSARELSGLNGYLLLAGKQDSGCRSIQADLGSLPTIELDRYLSDEEFRCVLHAADVIVLPYRNFDFVSSVLLKSAIAGARLVVADRGWMAIRAKSLGGCWTYKPGSVSELAASIKAASEASESANYERIVRNEIAKAHHPDRLVETLVASTPERK